MAIELSHDKYGKTFATAYHKVNTVSFSKTDDVIAVVDIYSVSAGEVIDQIQVTFTYDPNGDEPLTQVYDHLKTLGSYTGYTDV